MNADEYQDTQNRLLAAYLSLVGLPLAEFLGAIDRAETLGPIRDPTLYRAAADQLARIRTLAEGAKDLVRVMQTDPRIVLLATQAATRLEERMPWLTDRELSALIEACNVAKSGSRPRPPWDTDGDSAHEKLVRVEAARQSEPAGDEQSAKH